ncbi:MAG: CoA transferase [Alphaproteobacteria bacterium]|nr:CoA transferase [Alphaproteobacteria bacterium]
MAKGNGVPSSAGPLDGIRVLDLTSVVLGPLATRILGDYGADVIKVESTAGDLMRANGVSRHPGMSSIFLALNRNKRSLAIDLQTSEGRAAFARLIPTADVLVHNMRVEAIERLGFGYEATAALNPSVVYCAATGFDQDGPDRAKPAFDDIIQAASGMVSIASIGRDEPSYVPTLIADKTAGLAVVNAILAALFHRARTGHGQYVEVPMFETFTDFVLAEHLGGLTFDPPAGPAGYARLLEGGRKPSPTKDGHIALLPYTAKHWIALFKAIDRLDIVETLQVEDKERRNANIRPLYSTLARITPHRTTGEWMEICERLDIPATPLVALDDLPNHAQLKAVELFKTMDHPTEGTIQYVRPSTKFMRSPVKVAAPAPALGWNSREILGEAGCTDEEIEMLITRGVVVQHSRTG